MLARLHRDVIGPAREDKQAGIAPIVLVMGGTNDIFFSGTDRQARADITAICHQLQAEGIAPLIGVPPPVDWSHTPDKWKSIVDFQESAPRVLIYNDWLRNFSACAGLKAVDFCADFLTSSGQVRHELFYDGIHPNGRGHRKMAERLGQALLLGV